ncbi:MAG: FixH family protein [Cellvibrionaceae bacterium]
MSTTEHPDTDQEPWYKQFWPWFLIILPGTVVIAAIGTVIVAFKNQPDLVTDDYYRSGLEINEVLKQDMRAAELALQAEIFMDKEVGEIVIDLRGNLESFPSALVLKFLHTQKARRDHWVKLRHIANGRYTGDFGQNRLTRWYLRLTPGIEGDNALTADNTEWRLTGQLNTSSDSKVTLVPIQNADQ